MTTFLIAATLVLAASLALLSRPWWRKERTETDTRRALNAAIYRDQLLELEKDRAGGELNETDFQEARAELQRRLLEDATEAASTAEGAAAAPSRRTLGVLLVFLPLAAAGLYWWLGNPTGLDPMARRDFTASDIEDMVSGLAAKLEKEPNNHQGWLMLARSYKAMGRYDEAERAFEKAMPVVERDAQLLGAYADLLAAKAGGSLEGKPERVIARALKLDPNDLQSLWLAGTAAFNRKDFPAALKHWEHALKQLPPESEDAQMLNSIIAEARQKMGTQKSAASSAITGRVEIAAAHRGKVAPTDTVFILARLAESPMPVAVKRAKVGDLPMEFKLDDTDAIPGGTTLSGAKSVIVEARVSKSGDARQKPGDLVGSLSQIRPGTMNLKVAIDKVVE
jgi:cytochrome c-type biogenesis protein CcmH